MLVRTARAVALGQSSGGAIGAAHARSVQLGRPHTVRKYSADQTLQHTKNVFFPVQDSKGEECSQQCKETLSSLRESVMSGFTLVILFLTSQ